MFFIALVGAVNEEFDLAGMGGVVGGSHNFSTDLVRLVGGVDFGPRGNINVEIKSSLSEVFELGAAVQRRVVVVEGMSLRRVIPISGVGRRG